MVALWPVLVKDRGMSSASPRKFEDEISVEVDIAMRGTQLEIGCCVRGGARRSVLAVACEASACDRPSQAIVHSTTFGHD